tara:strand:- start:425 stop:964 length:540 start_codon:yes stop_codon:yes gene_type:complete
MTYFDRLFAYAFQVCRSYEMAKDIVSEVFYNLLNANRDFSGISNIQAYLYKSVKNQAIKAISVDPLSFESEKHREQMSFVETTNPQDLLVGKELEDIVKNLIEDLPPNCQLVFRMVREEGLSYEEAAKRLGVTPKTVKNQLFLALGKIRSGLTTHFKDTPIIKLISNLSCILIGFASML